MEKIDLKGSLTEQNLLKAFAGESQAAARYRMYAKQARKDGFEKVACFFDETVHNELRHGKIYFEFLQGGMVEITASCAAGVRGTTLENLDEADHEVAKQEGFSEIARQFAMIAEIERTHMERFRGLYDTMKDGHIFVKEEDTVWRCMECGHIYIGKKAPNRCPVCQHPQALFEIKCDRY